MIKLVIVDFDDTLCLTEHASFLLENESAKSMGFAPMSRKIHRANWGKPLQEAIIERIPGIDPEVFMNKYEKLIPGFVQKGKLDTISEINLDTLDAIKKSGRKLAILTSRQLVEARHLLHEDHPLGSRIEAFYHKDNSEYTKPNPKVFDKILSFFQIKPTETVYVGDSITDALCTKQAGIHFIAVLESGLRTKKDFQGIPVDFFAKTFPDILQYINR